ncbi:hypothetical protein L6252_04125 [Candidatus Parcubacteria bacterium]|nr:hypothetical protein [Candidatus Parcubacteria bacterium]
MSKKIFIIATVLVLIFSGFFYCLLKNNNKIRTVEYTDKIIGSVHPFISWQKITITEEEQNIFIAINVPRVIIYDGNGLASKVNEAVMSYINLLKDDFIFSVGTAAFDDRGKNTLNIDTESLLTSPYLISLSFTASRHLAGIKDDEPEQTFLVFDLARKRLVKSDKEFFISDSAWAKTTEMAKSLLLFEHKDYKTEVNCDLFFAPKCKGLATSCIGIDHSRANSHLSVEGEMPLLMVQDFISKEILSEIYQFCD